MAEQNHPYKWQDIVNLLLAIWLFISPWALRYYPGGQNAQNALMAAAWTAWILGIVIAVFSIAALVQMKPWEEWINLIAGALLFISPWVLGYYTSLHVAMWNAFIVGALVFILAIWELYSEPQMAGRSV